MAETIANLVRPPVARTEATRQSADQKEQVTPLHLEDTYIKVDELNRSVEKLKQIDWLTTEQWPMLDLSEKAVALNQAGQALAEVYRIPTPPLLVQTWDERYAFGAYGDGYLFNPKTDEVEGADYRIAMNSQAVTDYARLFGDDPAVALETYAHEFRHAYQAEQVLRQQKPQFRHLVDDPEAALAWQHEYISPDADFEAYDDQPVEKDARMFAEALVMRLYG